MKPGMNLKEKTFFKASDELIAFLEIFFKNQRQVICVAIRKEIIQNLPEDLLALFVCAPEFSHII